MAGAVLGLLEHEFGALVVGEGALHPFGLVADDQQPPFGGELLAAGEHALDEGGAGEGLEHLGQVALHARALSGGQYGNGEHRRGTAALPGIYRASPGEPRGGPKGPSNPQRRRQALVLSPPPWSCRRARSARISAAVAVPCGSR